MRGNCPSSYESRWGGQQGCFGSKSGGKDRLNFREKESKGKRKGSNTQKARGSVSEMCLDWNGRELRIRRNKRNPPQRPLGGEKEGGKEIQRV